VAAVWAQDIINHIDKQAFVKDFYFLQKKYVGKFLLLIRLASLLLILLISLRSIMVGLSLRAASYEELYIKFSSKTAS